MKNIIIILACMSYCLVSFAQTKWSYDHTWSKQMYSSYKSEMKPIGHGVLNLTYEQSDEIAQNLIFFFAADTKSRTAYVERITKYWSTQLQLGSMEVNLLRKLGLQMYTSSDKEIIKTMNELRTKSDHDMLNALLEECGANNFKSGVPQTPFEVNQVGVIMTGLWTGIITVAVLDLTKELILALVPGVQLIQDGLRELFDSVITGAGFLTKKIGEGASVAVQFVGNALKNLFSKKGDKGKKSEKEKKKDTKSVIALPNGQGDCCGYPFPTL